MTRAKGVLLVNLGTPDTPRNRDVYRYLIEFLTDPRVIDKSWLARQLLVRGIIVPFRYRQSAETYRKIWTEHGSPLLVYSERLKELLQNELGDLFIVELGMRYQNPSIAHALKKFHDAKVDKIVVIPLFPQYASATTGSIHEKVMSIVRQWETIPSIHFVNSYPTEENMVQAFCARAKESKIEDCDHIVFSFHGLPERQVRKCDQYNWCFQVENCCSELNQSNHHCYSAQCHATAGAIAKELNINNYSISFQSRLGREPWLQPYTSETLLSLQKKGKKNVGVFCPAFVCDCLETIYEIGVEYQQEFIEAGGQSVTLVPGLNDHPLWVKALYEITLAHI